MNIPSSFQLATAGQSQKIDAETIRQLDIPGRLLMEVAGAKAADIIAEHTRPGSRVLIFCGKGNNAGDALVVARFLSQNNIGVSVVFVEGVENLSPDTKVNFAVLKKLRDKSDQADIAIYEHLPESLPFNNHDFVIDGLLGTGIKNNVREPYGPIINEINKSGKKVFSLDLPSGLHADSGDILGTCIKADYTFCFGMLKSGCYFGNGPDMSGEIFFCDLGFPAFLKSSVKRYVISPDWVDSVAITGTSPRHKYEAGIVYTIAGSPGLTGAAILAAKSAWAEGLGSTSVITPGGLLNIFESHLIHQTKLVTGSHEDTIFKSDHLDEILKHLHRRKGTVILGPGLGRDDETAELVRQFITKFKGNIVVDADAIHAISEDLSILSKTSASVILTPHPGELKSLIGSDISNSYERMKAVETFCLEHKAYVLSKGLPAVIGTPGGQTYITNYNSTIFARTGYGDILAGKIAALWEQTGSRDYSCIKALLDGKKRYDNFIKHHSTIPEPLDLI